MRKTVICNIAMQQILYISSLQASVYILPAKKLAPPQLQQKLHLFSLNGNSWGICSFNIVYGGQFIWQAAEGTKNDKYPL